LIFWRSAATSWSADDLLVAAALVDDKVLPLPQTRIVAAIHKATNFRLDYDSIRLKDRARAVAIEMGRQPLLMQFGFDTYVFEDVGLPLHLKDCTHCRKGRLHPFQLIPSRQPTVGIDGNLQQIVHLPTP
jgi:hypothetical protein